MYKALCLLQLEIFVVLLFRTYIPGGVTFFFILGICLWQLCFGMLLKNNLLQHSVLVVTLAIGAFYGYEIIQTKNHAETLVSELETLRLKNQLNEEIALKLIKRDHYLKEKFINFEIESDGNFNLFFYYIHDFITHWYTSTCGWGNSDD
jgi:hypothetical protein